MSECWEGGGWWGAECLEDRRGGWEGVDGSIDSNKIASINEQIS